MAVKHMPMSSLIIGIDLDPIRAIKGCITLVGDITTQKSRQVRCPPRPLLSTPHVPALGTSRTQQCMTKLSSTQVSSLFALHISKCIVLHLQNIC